jgi:hypothetical protein
MPAMSATTTANVLYYTTTTTITPTSTATFDMNHIYVQESHATGPGSQGKISSRIILGIIIAIGESRHKEHKNLYGPICPDQ